MQAGCITLVVSPVYVHSSNRGSHTWDHMPAANLRLHPAVEQHCSDQHGEQILCKGPHKQMKHLLGCLLLIQHSTPDHCQSPLRMHPANKAAAKCWVQQVRLMACYGPEHQGLSDICACASPAVRLHVERPLLRAGGIQQTCRLR